MERGVLHGAQNIKGTTTETKAHFSNQWGNTLFNIDISDSDTNHDED